MKKSYFLLFLISSVSFSQNNNLIAEWKLDGNGNDSSGNNNNATQISAINTTNRNGEENKAYYFDGVNSYIDFTVSNLPKGNSERTISGWFKSDMSYEYSVHTNFFYTIIDYGNPLNLQRFCLQIYSKAYLETLLSEEFNKNDFYVNNYDYLNNNWYFFTFVYDGKKTKIYSNGQLAGSKEVILDTQSEQNKFRIGRKNNNQNASFRGSIDDISFYSKALTDNEILELYQKSVLSIKTINEKDENIIVYPVIFKEKINISNIKSDKLSLYIYSQNGALIKKFNTKKERENILLQGISSGIYILKIVNNTKGNIEFRKIIKK
ncbi:LamG-like jellyroll fold domain-containing protein [Polaribacter sp. 11A2H]|uniref:LamG-like jellyroll fold domain-containing protein n=1 Tax=Polaribacter sp. 11A2H TaxID=2687290 RepID=UPI00140C67FD|nr:LamG-like jellyroll fold domain-containing protein [Polaribacter sp. 11A2H]